MTLDPVRSPGVPPLLLSIGNVHVTEQHVITPAGTWPLADVNVTTSDQTSTTTHTPAWAIVMVFLFIWFFLLSLLFLLARETRISGFIAVHIQARGYSYTEQVPVYSAQERADVLNRVLFLQGAIGQARNRHAY
ncbi:hypothetical protein [Arthrobacter sp. UYCu712]|uniref:hypothetical protein n=1 Tax=Arthrobacter sp. UYCu712 TaxID=3156340 RepID=UPI003390AE27